MFFIVFLIFQSINKRNNELKYEESCKIVCENNNMTYEGIKNGLCVCNPSLGVRVFLENEPFFNVTVNSSLGNSANLRFSPKFYEKYKEL